MSWIRLDDGFASHPKLARLSAEEFRVWMRVLCFCARYEDPTVDEVALSEVKGLTKERVTKYETVGLLDKHKQSLLVHDWKDYQPKDATGAERQARWRANRNGNVTP